MESPHAGQPPPAVALRAPNAFFYSVPMKLTADSDSITLPLCTGLALACLVIYGQTLAHGFISYDDGLYVFENPRVAAGLSWENVVWAFTSRTAMYVHPVTWLSHMLDCTIFGLRPWGHHLTNLLLHALNAILLYLAFARMTRRQWPSAFVAALFAVHPLHVESVAWVAERKDMLSMLFWAAALHAYAWHRERPGTRRYLAVAFLFLLALLSKPMAVTLPCVLLLLDYWPLHRVDRTEPVRDMARAGARLFFEKLPLFAMTALFSVITMVMQMQGNNLEFGRNVPLLARCANAVAVYALYLVKTVWPFGLAVYYPHPIHRPLWQVAGAAVLLLAVTLLCLAQARRRPWLIVGWLWYLGTLVPVIELVQAGSFSHADRYTYIPLIGIFVMVVWSLDEIAEKGRGRARLLFAAGLAVVLALTAAAHRQTAYWKNDLTLFTHALSVTPDNPVARNNLGAMYVDQGKVKEAAEQYEIALKLDPANGETQYNLGVMMSAMGRTAEAEHWYREALKNRPNHPKALNNLGGILAEAGKADEAMEYYRKAVAAAPDFADAHNNLANLLATAGQLDAALVEYGKALDINPNHINVRLNVALICMRHGVPDEARRQLDQVLRIDPKNAYALKMLDQLNAPSR